MPLVNEIMFDTIEETLNDVELIIVPKEFVEDFENGDIAFSDFADFEQMDYYNSLLKQKIFLFGVAAALITAPSKKEIPIKPPAITTGGSFIDVLDSDEFAEQGFNNPVVQLTENYVYHQIKRGESLQTIALQYYDDYKQWTRIADANLLSDNDLIDEDRIGESIKIPVDKNATLKASNANLVYEFEYDPSNPASIEKYLFGVDIDSTEKKVHVDSQGDLKTISGSKNAIKDVERRINTIKGGLNPMNPDYGIDLYNQENVFWIVSLEETLKDIEDQIQSDPRVVSAFVDRDNITINGDAIYCDITTKLLGDNEETWKQKIKNT